MQKALNNLETRFNNLDQHHRGWGVRLLNIPLNMEEEMDPQAVRQKVYELALLLILTGAKNAGRLKLFPLVSSCWRQKAWRKQAHHHVVL
jgi:hypothetical protein